MEKHTFFLKEEQYFSYFKTIYDNQSFSESYPLISNRMRSLCQEIKEKVHGKEPDNFFRLHAEVLGLDAQLQILLTLVEMAEDNSLLSEEMILKCSREDYQSFMKELCGSEEDKIINHSLYFSVI